VRELEGWEVDIFRAHDRGERDVHVLRAQSGRHARTVRRLLADDEADLLFIDKEDV